MGDSREKKSPGVRLVFGSVLLLIGTLLLLKTTGHIPSFGSLWPVLLILIGLLFLFYSGTGVKSQRYVFLGMILLLIGVFYLLLNTVISVMDMKKLWPVFMTIIGVSMIPYGLAKSGHGRIVLIVPGGFLTALSLVFLVFSLGMTDVRFSLFVIRWWPCILIVFGILFLVSHFRKKKRTRNQIS